VAEAAAVEPILRGLRDEQCRLDPDLGLWTSGTLNLMADGTMRANFYYDERPTIGGAPADIAEGRADLARAPRPKRWVPVWLK
jgi:hypothetical protein